MIKVLITYEYFLPAYKAGGPIQSIANLCRHLGKEICFYIICGSKDHTEREDLKDIIKDEWNDFENGKATVHYVSKPNQRKNNIIKLIKEISPDYIFINGLYSPIFSLVPLFFCKQKKILSVRGMLHPGALSQKIFKKKFFLFLLKLLRVHKKTIFHVTDGKEREYVRNIFGKNVKIVIAQNFPNVRSFLNTNRKVSGRIKLISTGLISPMKNHALVLKGLEKVKSKVIYDIYGPIKDIVYWEECLQIISTLPTNITVSYKGSVEPNKLESITTLYDLFILPSKSENFGHAIFEALSAGIPVITSHFTPWNNLIENKAGINVDIEDVNSITEAIEYFAALDNIEFSLFSTGSFEYSKRKVNIDNISAQYKSLFLTNN